MSIVIKRRELVKLLHGLNSVSNVVGTKFAYAVNKSKKEINNALSIGFFSVLVVSIFSPYMNHPLGIGLLLIFLVYLIKNNRINF